MYDRFRVAVLQFAQIIDGLVVVEHYCFFIIIIAGPPYFPDPVWPLKKTHFSKLYTNLALVDYPLNRALVVLLVFFASNVARCESITDFR